jgi:hypothetical protein
MGSTDNYVLLLLHGLIERQSDISLRELQVELREACNVEVSLVTIMCSLQREGYTMKTVCFHRIGPIVLIASMTGHTWRA